ncbi:MAG: hypothetical protein IJW77_15585 [Clostridia bacterium]|nr:hypothetical protein [Clostridia bacterium]
MKQIIFALASLLCVSSIFSSCADAADTPAVTQSTDTEAVTETAEAVTTSHEDTVRSQIGQQDFGGYTFRVVSRDPGGDFYNFAGTDANEIYFEAETGDILNDAIFLRNRKTEELLNIKIEPVWVGTGRGHVLQTTESNILAGDDFADAIVHSLDFAMNSAAKGMLYNFYDIPTVQLDNPWWDQTIISNFTMFGDHLYALCGDIVFFDDYAVQAIIGNTRLMAQYDIEVPYQSVRDGTWTFDQFAEMAKLGFADLNGDGKIDRETDQIGYGNHEGAVMHFVYCFDQRLSTTQDDGTIVVNSGNEKIINAIDTVVNFLAECDGAIGGDNPTMFHNGQTMFFMEMIGGITALRDMEDDYCVLPMPKGDEAMEGYKAYVSNGWTTCYTVPTTAPEVARIGTVLETMSAISADTVTPALYDVMLQEKYVRDPKSQEMLTYIWASKSYDLAGDLDWASDLRNIYYDIAAKANNNFVSSIEKKIKMINKKLENFMNAFTE